MELQKEPSTNEEWRAFYYKKESDILLLSHLAYDKEGETAKAATQLGLWNAKKAEIRARFP